MIKYNKKVNYIDVKITIKLFVKKKTIKQDVSLSEKIK